LIHADLAHLDTVNSRAGIYMNPYVRVAYSRSVLAWLPFTKRFERLYPFVQSIINVIGQRPGYNPRRLEQPGDEVVDRVWQWDEESLTPMRNGTVGQSTKGLQGSFHEVQRIAQPGQFCGSRKLLYIKNHAERKGGKKWGTEIPVADD